MPLPLTTEIEVVQPNTYRYDLSVATRISEGQLYTSVSVILAPSCCVNDVWEEVYTDKQRPCFQTGDLYAYAAANPDIAPLILQAQNALHAVVAAINAKEGLL